MPKSTYVLLDSVTGIANIEDHLYYFLDEEGDFQWNELQFEQFRLMSEFDENSNKKSKLSKHWFLLSVENNTSKKQAFAFSSRWFVKTAIFIQGVQEFEQYEYGLHRPLHKKSFSRSGFSTREELSVGEKKTFLFQCKLNHLNPGISKIKLTSLKEDVRHTNAIISDNLGLFYFRIVFWGIIFFLCLFTLGQYTLNGDRSFLLYALYLFSTLLFSLNINEFFNRVPLLFYYIPGSVGCHSLLSYVVIISYTVFAIEFVDLKNSNPRAYSFAKWFIWGTVVVGVINLILFLIPSMENFESNYYRGSRAFSYIPMIVLLIMIWRKRDNPLVKYFVFGSSFMVLGTIVSLLVSIGIWQDSNNIFFTDALILNQLGFLIEFLFFSLGIGYKTRMAQIEKSEVQQKLIAQLQENQELQEQLNTKLQFEIEESKEAVIRTEYENKILQLESELLQSQMNPHFIFNSLNSIKHYALTKEPRETVRYITKFAKLMRTVLQNSKAQLVLLEDEIEALKLYIEIENKRFNERFDYEIKVDESIGFSEIYIPPLLIQPYIENAIWHGLMHKSGSKKLEVEFSTTDEHLYCVVRDNGVGRKMSMESKSSSNMYKKKSLGTKITQNRFEMINQVFGKKAEANIIDLYNANGDAIGTEVRVIIPKLYKDEETKNPFD